LKDGVTQPTISLKSIKSVNLKVPSDEIQKNAAIKIDSMYSLKNKMIGVYSTKLKDLMQFKKSLLQQAFFGNLVED
jgi:restriction endonuclease S subunit